MTTKSNSEAGYTITELLVVLVILGLIAAAISPQIFGRLDSSKIRAARIQLETVSASLDAFLIDVGRYPTEEEGVKALVSAPESAVGWLGPYVRSNRNLVDPWGETLVYSLNADGRPIVATMGADREEGGEGAAADLKLPE